MPVQKFRTLEEAAIALWMSPDDPTLPRKIRGWWRTCARMSREIGPRGVRRFAVIGDANAEQLTWQLVTIQPDPTR